MIDQSPAHATLYTGSAYYYSNVKGERVLVPEGTYVEIKEGRATIELAKKCGHTPHLLFVNSEGGQKWLIVGPAKGEDLMTSLTMDTALRIAEQINELAYSM